MDGKSLLGMLVNMGMSTREVDQVLEGARFACWLAAATGTPVSVAKLAPNVAKMKLHPQAWAVAKKFDGMTLLEADGVMMDARLRMWGALNPTGAVQSHDLALRVIAYGAAVPVKGTGE